jgi:CDP-glucose 4,6-dehydratase
LELGPLSLEGVEMSVAGRAKLDHYRGKNVFVTGDTGFKGSWLCLWLLSLGAKVTGYALPFAKNEHFDACGLSRRIRHIDGDVRDAERLERAMRKARPEIAFHLAAQPLVLESYKEPAETFDVNVVGTVSFLDAVRSCGPVRAAVVVTTDKVYQNPEDGAAFAETDPLGGADPYSASKAAAEIVVQSYTKSFFTDRNSSAVASARAGNVIGGGDFAQHRIVPDCVRALWAGRPIVVRNPGSVRPWQHVLEPLFGYLLLGASLLTKGNECSGAWNFGSSPAHARTVLELAHEFVAEWGFGTVTYNSSKNSAPHEARYLRLNSAKAARRLGWRPVLGFNESVRNTVDEYRAMESAPKDALYKDRMRRIREFETRIA